MKKPQRNRIPLRPDQKAEGEERAYTSNYGDRKPERAPRREGDGEGRKPFFKKDDGTGERKKSFGSRDGNSGGERKPFYKKEEGAGADRKRSFSSREGGERKPFADKRAGEWKKPFSDKEGGERKPFYKKEDGEKRPYQKREGSNDFSKKEGFRKPYSGGEKPDAGGFERKERSSFNRTEGGEKRTSFSGERKPFQNREGGERKSYGQREGGERKPYNADAPRGERKPFEKREGGERKPFQKREGEERKPFEKREGGERKPFEKREGSERRPFVKREGEDRKPSSRAGKRPYDRKPGGEGSTFPPAKRSYEKPEGADGSTGKSYEKKPYRTSDGEGKSYEKKSFRTGEKSDRKTAYGSDRPRKDSGETGETSGPKPRRRTFREGDEKPAAEGTGMTLNKYLSHAGICGRREAGEIVKSGKVSVNGEVLLTPGYRVQPGDVVTHEGRVVKPEVAKVYVLLNKPKGFITTTEDEAERHTVMELVQSVEAERLYPVGRLDRNTTGVLLLTNDGDLAQRLTHPKYECKKIYQVTVDKDVTKADLEALATGITLEDGEIKADEVAYLESKSEIGIEIHSGRNRIVRRMFEHLGYVVEKLDRVMFAGLTKKNVPRGKYRLLTEKEVILLKHFKG